MLNTMRVIHPDGRQEVHELTPETDRYGLLKSLIGGWPEYLPAHYHALQEHEVVIDEEGLNKDLPPNWVGSRSIGLDLTQYPPLRGPLVVVPHAPEDGPCPAQRRRTSASPDNLVNLYARALEGDAQALKTLGVSDPEQITVIDARPEREHWIYLIHPDGRTERTALASTEAAHRWIDDQLGEAYRLPEQLCGVSAYAVIYSVCPGDRRPNLPAQKALGLKRPLRGPVVLAPTGQPDPSLAHQRLDEALSGRSGEARAELGLFARW